MNRITAAVVAGMVAGSAHAHHSNDYHFDRNVGVTVSGTVKMFRFINPHARLRTVERLTLGESGDSFELTIVAEDALYYTEPVTTTRSFLASDQVPREYNCTHPELGH